MSQSGEKRMDYPHNIFIKNEPKWRKKDGLNNVTCNFKTWIITGNLFEYWPDLVKSKPIIYIYPAIIKRPLIAACSVLKETDELLTETKELTSSKYL